MGEPTLILPTADQQPNFVIEDGKLKMKFGDCEISVPEDMIAEDIMEAITAAPEKAKDAADRLGTVLRENRTLWIKITSTIEQIHALNPQAVAAFVGGLVCCSLTSIIGLHTFLALHVTNQLIPWLSNVISCAFGCAAGSGSAQGHGRHDQDMPEEESVSALAKRIKEIGDKVKRELINVRQK